LITVVELTGVGAIISARTFQYVGIYAMITIIYLATTFAIVKASHLIEFQAAITRLTTGKRMRF